VITKLVVVKTRRLDDRVGIFKKNNFIVSVTLKFAVMYTIYLCYHCCDSDVLSSKTVSVLRKLEMKEIKILTSGGSGKPLLSTLPSKN
jgi:hypothetical protein